jgi:hypothetical protein
MHPSTTSLHRHSPALRRLTLAKESLRRLAPGDLRRAAGGHRTSSNSPLGCRGGRGSWNPTSC